MDLEPQIFFANIRELLKDSNVRGPSECFRQLSLLNYNLTEEELNSSVVDLYIIHVFNKSNGLISFITDALAKNEFERCVIKGLEIIFTLINNFPQKLGPFILDANILCMNIAQGLANAKVKTKALEVLLLSFEKVDKCLENQEHYIGIFGALKDSLRLKHCDSVKHKEYAAVGYFCKKFSYVVQDHNAVRNIFILHLDKEMEKNKAHQSQYIICGIFTALDNFLEAFPLSLEKADDKKLVIKLYAYLKALSIPKSKIKIGNRAAILFLGNHISSFTDLLVKQYSQWHAALMNWLSMAEQERKVGVAALRSYFRGIAKAVENMASETARPIITHFLRSFKYLLVKADATKDEKRLAIQGLKFFSSAFNKHLSEEELPDIFMMIMQHFERTYILGGDASNEEWNFLPDYIQCIAYFMQYQKLSSTELFCIQRAVVNMIKTFHGLQKMHHIFVIDALVNTLFSLMKTHHFDVFLENVIYQGVVWSCSHHHVSDAELQPDFKQIVTVKSYFPLWAAVLKLSSDRSYDKYGIYLEERMYILTQIINQLVKTLMILINKLNVSVKPKDDVIATDLEEAYDVVHRDDYAIFLNIVDFYQDVFNHIEPRMFEKCICKMIVHFINKCIKFPLVSGFYRLLSYALKIFNKLNLYDKKPSLASSCSGESDPLVQNTLKMHEAKLPFDSVAEDVEHCKESLSKFIISLLHSMNEFKDELLISCLQVLLETPVNLIKDLLTPCTEVFITVFDVGRSYIALAEMGLKTLKYWQENIDPDDFEEFVIKVSPCLDTYLRSKSLGGLMQAATIEKRRKTAQQLKKRKVLVEIEPELVKFQNKVLKFIGTQKNTVCEAFVSPDHVIEKSIISHNLHLKITLPYKDTVLDVYLEPFVCRIVELSLYCSDRKTRIMACELLQAVTMVLLGRTKSMSQKGLEDLEELLRFIAMPLLQLGCDVDQVVEQIFNPLFMEIIHWYTSPTQMRGPHTAIIIEVVMEGITHPTNSRLRDFSGKCIHEFIKWTIKQTNEARIAEDPINIKIVVKKMRYFSSHPDIAKKLGTALLFNNIYKELREERSLTSIFSFEILHILITSLSLISFPNQPAEVAVKQIYIALRHLKRIFIEKPQVFRENDRQRRVPNDIPEPNLTGIAKYLLQQTGSTSKFCRDISMELFLSIAPLAACKIHNLSNFVKDNYTSNCTDLYELYLSSEPSAPYKETLDCKVLHEWLQALFCSIDGYNFLITNSLCDIQFSTDGQFYKAVNYFLDKMRCAKITDALNLVCFKSWNFDLQDKEQFDVLKSSCILGFLKLTNTVLSDPKFGDTCELFWNDRIVFQFLIDCLFTPHLLGVDEDKHLEILTVLLGTIKRKVLKENRFRFVEFIYEYLKIKFNPVVDLRKNINLAQRNMVKGLILLEASNIDELPNRLSVYATKLLDAVMADFLLNVKANKAFFVTELPETALEYCKLVFQFVMARDCGFKDFLKYYYDLYAVQIQTWEFHREMSFPLYLLMKFGYVFVKVFINKFDVFMENIQALPAAMEFILFVLNFKHTINTQKRYLTELSGNLLRNWSVFEIYFNKEEEKAVEFLESAFLVCKQKPNGCPEIEKWIFKLLTNEQLLWGSRSSQDMSVRVFSMLVLITSDTDTACQLELRDALSFLSQKILEEIKKKPENIIIVEKMLAVAPNIKSTQIFTFLIDLYSRVNTNKEILNDIQDCIKNNDRTTQSNFLTSIYELCLSVKLGVKDITKIITRVLPPLFRSCSLTVFENFFENYISKIVQSLENTSDLVGGMLHFTLVDILFLRLPIGVPERVNCRITAAYGNAKLRQKILKITLDAFKVKLNGSELLRPYKCHAYNALASVISNSLKTYSFYDKLFIREDDGRDILWHSLIDTNVSYNFPMELETIPKQRKILTNIRDELRAQNAEEERLQSLKYIESQRLFKSSLSEDISKFDFTNTILRSNFSSSGSGGQENAQNTSSVAFQSKVELDGTEINNHECMATICGIIEHVFKSGINELPSEGDEVTLPTWMQGIHNLLLNKSTHRNVKIFLVKVIDNNIGVFQHFSKWFVTPLLQFIVDGCAGDNINYFVTDVLVILASWANSVTPNEVDTELASQVLRFITEKLRNERQDVFKYVLDLIKMLVENWKNFLRAPYAIIFSKLNHAITDRKIEAGIHLASVFFVNDICPCPENDKIEFLKKLLNIMTSDLRSIYKPCAETVGLLLAFVSKNSQNEAEYIEETNELLRTFAEGDSHKYGLCLEGIALHFPKLVDSFHLCKILSRINCTDHNLKIVYLKIILKRIEALDEVSDFQHADWSGQLDDDNPEVQLLSLEIMLRSIKLLERHNMFTGVMGSICKNVSSPNILCRNRMYDILTEIYGNCVDVKPDVLELCKDILIQGLTDTDKDIREDIREFWSKNPTVPQEIKKKFPYILSELYRTKTEEHFLGYASFFLLELIRENEVDKEIFDNPLEDCNFEEYHLKTNWRLLHPSVVPMFADTFRTVPDELDLLSEGSFNVLRGTQDQFSFSPTQQSLRDKHISQVTSLESSLLISTELSPEDSFINPNQIQMSQKYRLPKKRFLKDKTKIAQNFAHFEVNKQMKKVEKRYESVREGEKKVTIYRKYRKGDFPDIQITLGSLLKPLQMLALYDGELSKILFSVIFKSLNNTVECNNNFITSISGSIEYIFTNSTQFNTNLFSTLLDIILKNKSVMRFEPNLVANVCQQSGLLSVGTLLLEEYIIIGEDGPSASKRGVAVQENTDMTCWLKLAELYKEMGEWDIVRTIFLEKMNCKEDVQSAIKFESARKWRQAEISYRKLVETDLSLERRDFYYESLFKCIAHLGEWEHIPEAIKSMCEDANKVWPALWDNGWYQQKILPWYISAQVKTTLFSGNVTEEFLRDLNSSFANVYQSEYLRSNFSQELCLLWLFKRDTAQANQYLKHSLENFLSDWQMLNPMFQSIRYNKILNLRNIIDVDNFLNAEEHLGDDCLKVVKELFSYWDATQKEYLPSIILSEEKLLNRRLFVKLLIEKLTKMDQTNIVKSLKNSQLCDMDLKFVELATEEENYYMARKYFQGYSKIIKEKHNSRISVVYGELSYLKFKITPGVENRLNILISTSAAFGNLFKYSVGEVPLIKGAMKYFDVNLEIANIISEDNEVFATVQPKLQELFKNKFEISPENIISFSEQELKNCLIGGLEPLESMEENSSARIRNLKNNQYVTKALMKLAYYVKGQRDRQSDFVLFVLQAMRLDCVEARQLFACILLMDNLGTSLKDLFLSETEKIPTWMFLGWIPQLLANIDSTKIFAISGLLMRIAKTYPQAIAYSYRLSKSNYKFDEPSIKEAAEVLVEQLDKLLLNSDIVNKFLRGLSNVSVPAASLEYYLKKMQSTKDIHEVISFRNQLLGDMYGSTPDSRDNTYMLGNMYKTISRFREDLLKINERSSDKAVRQIVTKINDERQKIHGEKGKTPSVLLKDYCPWLASLSANKSNLDLEIPGQYTGDKMPLVQHHVRISGFVPTVKVMTSLRRPIKVTMLGMDAKEYPFLVKFGEDIRQDQRIEQVFVLMNNIFRTDMKHHQLLTYQVIPLTPSLGIIQWIENTMSLSDFIKIPLGKNKKLLNAYTTAENKYFSFVSNKNNNLHEYGKTAIRKDSNKIVPFYRELINLVPWDVLRSSLWSMTPSTENFIAFRNNFINSYAVICACHWILGIGDRHLNNSKVCMQNGNVLGIDFGHAFGTGTQILPIPELVPIRLTPHIVSLMEPLRERGSFRDIMIDCLRSLRKNKEILLATMNVFIQEPSLDWLENAARFGDDETTRESHEWYPNKKIDQAERKLRGASSAEILIEDLEANKISKDYIRAYINHVRGTPECKRNQLNIKSRHLSVEDQVDSLIDHATDYNLLGRMYLGWYPWI